MQVSSTQIEPIVHDKDRGTLAQGVIVGVLLYVDVAVCRVGRDQLQVRGAFGTRASFSQVIVVVVDVGDRRGGRWARNRAVRFRSVLISSKVLYDLY